MKVKKISKCVGFQPLKVEITIESEEELRNFAKQMGELVCVGWELYCFLKEECEKVGVR